jgi:hypothetical protein
MLILHLALIHHELHHQLVIFIVKQQHIVNDLILLAALQASQKLWLGNTFAKLFGGKEHPNLYGVGAQFGITAKIVAPTIAVDGRFFVVKSNKRHLALIIHRGPHRLTIQTSCHFFPLNCKGFGHGGFGRHNGRRFAMAVQLGFCGGNRFF